MTTKKAECWRWRAGLASGSPSTRRWKRGAARARRLRVTERPRRFRRPTAALAFAVVLVARSPMRLAAACPWFGAHGASTGRIRGARTRASSWCSRSGIYVLTEKSGTAAPAPAAAAGDPGVAATMRERRRPAAAGSRFKRAAPARSARSPAPRPLVARGRRGPRRARRRTCQARARGSGKSDDATTRAKARLGLAQLAQARGDCTTARRFALEVASMPGVDVSLVKTRTAIVRLE